MKLGTKSLLFGVHQFIWHPVTVYLAWLWLYGKLPNIKETICIVIHDWGYWGSPNMDGAEGERHPEWAALFATRYLGEAYGELCLFHSRHYAAKSDESPSRLCWADKLSMLFDPMWFYLLRARLSGEIKEYRKRTEEAGYLPMSMSDKVWYLWLRGHLERTGVQRCGVIRACK